MLAINLIFCYHIANNGFDHIIFNGFDQVSWTTLKLICKKRDTQSLKAVISGIWTNFFLEVQVVEINLGRFTPDYVLSYELLSYISWIWFVLFRIFSFISAFRKLGSRDGCWERRYFSPPKIREVSFKIFNHFITDKETSFIAPEKKIWPLVGPTVTIPEPTVYWL